MNHLPPHRMLAGLFCRAYQSLHDCLVNDKMIKDWLKSRTKNCPTVFTKDLGAYWDSLNWKPDAPGRAIAQSASTGKKIQPMHTLALMPTVFDGATLRAVFPITDMEY